MREDDPRLLSLDDGEDVALCALENALEDGQVGNDTTSVEEYETIIDNVISV